MSRRRGEFEHRTSIFEGAFRAWSHLGGLDPEDLETKSQEELDPFVNPIRNDTRRNGKRGENGKRDNYAYEPLPRAGLAHPFIQAILSPWLGPDADNDAIQLGLTTLRTWWQHRRKGESGSAVAALGTEKMRGVVEGYTRHFFQLAHCLIVNDKEQPPRSLQTKMKDLGKFRHKQRKQQSSDMMTNSSSLSPLEELHMAQQRQLQVEGGLQSCPPPSAIAPVIDIKNKCVPGQVNLPQVVDAVNRHAGQLAHNGISRNPVPVPSAVLSAGTSHHQQLTQKETNPDQYGDPEKVPIVLISETGDSLLAMSVDGITCAHCVKIVETVLKGCNGNKSPINGLLDAAADRVLNSVLIKIDIVANAKRIAFEAARNLAMVGYTATPKEISAVVEQGGKKTIMPHDAVYKVFSDIARSQPVDIFDWRHCACPDNGVLRDDCPRHSQMDAKIFEAFDDRGELATQLLTGAKLQPQDSQLPNRPGPPQLLSYDSLVMQQMPGSSNPSMMGMNMRGLDQFQGNAEGRVPQRAQRNSIISFGGRNMSFTSEYGRSMSGLSALSIDWENMEDFDVNVDHSAHINDGMNQPSDEIMEPRPIGGNGRGRRSSLRQSFMVGRNGNSNNNDAHVSFGNLRTLEAGDD